MTGAELAIEKITRRLVLSSNARIIILGEDSMEKVGELLENLLLMLAISTKS